jgi:hypothetical protein
LAEKKDDSWVPLALGLGGVVAGTVIGFFVLPQIVSLLNPKKEESKPTVVVKENPGPAPQVGEPLSYHSTRDIGPARLTYRMAHSSTSYDRQTQEQLARDRAIVTEADLVKQQALEHWKRRSVSLSPPEGTRLSYGSDGHGGMVQVDTPRPAKREWRVIKG